MVSHLTFVFQCLLPGCELNSCSVFRPGLRSINSSVSLTDASLVGRVISIVISKQSYKLSYWLSYDPVTSKHLPMSWLVCVLPLMMSPGEHLSHSARHKHTSSHLTRAKNVFSKHRSKMTLKQWDMWQMWYPAIFLMLLDYLRNLLFASLSLHLMIINDSGEHVVSMCGPLSTYFMRRINSLRHPFPPLHLLNHVF